MDKKTVSNYLLPIRDSSAFKDTHRLKVKEWKKIFHGNRNQKKDGVHIFISDKILKTKTTI